MIADEKETAVLGDILHALGVETDAAYEDKVPGRADEQPSVVAAVLVVYAFWIDQGSAYEQKYPIL